LPIDNGSLTDDPPPRSTAGIIAVAVVALAVFLMALRPLRSPDVWHHVKSGWYVVQNRGPASVDVFSCTAHGQPWIQYEWLAQLIIYGVYETAGATGLVLFQAAAAALVALLLMAAIRAGRRAGWAAGALAAALALCAASPRFFARPEEFTWILFAGWLVAVEKIRSGRTAYFLLPPILMVPWVNMHGAWPAGLAWLGLICAGETALLRLRPTEALPERTVLRLWAVLGLAAVATLINPYGVHIWQVPLKLSGSPEVREVIAEWRRPDWAHWLDPRHVGAWVFLAAILAAPRRIALPDALVLLAFGALALSARRHLAMAMIAVAPIAAAQFSLLGRRGSELLRAWLEGSARRKDSFLRALPRFLASAPLKLAGITLVCLALIAAALGGIRLKLAGVGLDKKTIPEGAAEFLQANKLAGNLFNSYHFGNYLLFRLYPENHVFIDGRVDVYGPKVLRLYAAVRNAEAGWQKILADHSVDICVLATERSTESRLLSALHGSPDWALVFWDNVSAVYVRHAPERATATGGARLLAPSLRSAYIYSVRPDDFDETVLRSPEALARAERDYRTKLHEDNEEPKCALAAYGLAECLLVSGRAEEAVDLLRRATPLNPENATLRYALGIALLDTGKLEEAERPLLETLELGQYEPEAQLALSVLYQKEGRLDAALSHCRKALDLSPDDRKWKALWNLSALCEQKGDLGEALTAAREVLRLRPDMASAAERARALQQKLAERRP